MTKPKNKKPAGIVTNEEGEWILPFNAGDRVRLNRTYCAKWKIPEWKEWGHRTGSVIYSDPARIDVLFDRVDTVRGRTIHVLITNPDLLEHIPKEEET